MGRGFLRWVTVAACVVALPALGHNTKRTDPCGCHHQYGLRHCHPKKKSPRCEAPAQERELKTSEASEQQGDEPERELPPPSDKAIRI